MHARTAALPGHLARARVLSRWFLEYHPGSTPPALGLDPGPGLRELRESLEVLVPRDLPTPEERGPLRFACTNAGTCGGALR
jgi:hypothetical protein